MEMIARVSSDLIWHIFLMIVVIYLATRPKHGIYRLAVETRYLSNHLNVILYNQLGYSSMVVIVNRFPVVDVR